MSLLIRPAQAADAADAAACGSICHDAFRAIATRHAFPPDFPSAEVEGARPFSSARDTRDGREGGLAYRRRSGSYNRPPMCSRALAFLLAFVMLWSGPAAQEHAFAFAVSADEPAAASVERAKQLHGGSVGHHPVDNLPAPGHAHIEAALDAQEMLTAAAALTLPGAGTAWPHAGSAPARVAPYLDGPQRPPRAGLLVA